MGLVGGWRGEGEEGKKERKKGEEDKGVLNERTGL